MQVQVVYEDGDTVIVEGDTWLEVIRQVGCTAMSLTVIPEESGLVSHDRVVAFLDSLGNDVP
jgi:hypothetical protein